jgi:hypothetical protein
MTTIEKKSLKVGSYVNTKHVDTVIRTYKQERWAQNSERIGKEDSLTCWYSIEELEGFLENAKQHGADGIKMQFAVYPADYSKVPEYAGRQTIVMIATKNKETENGCVDKDVYISTKEGTSILAYNAARLCPPYCGKPGDDSDWDGLGITIVDRGEKGLTIV